MSPPTTKDPWVARLLADPILAQAPYTELARLLPYLEERTLAPGATLYRAGDKAAFRCIATGLNKNQRFVLLPDECCCR
jgi:hypothetical protein